MCELSGFLKQFFPTENASEEETSVYHPQLQNFVQCTTLTKYYRDISIEEDVDICSQKMIELFSEHISIREDVNICPQKIIHVVLL